jgi:hypothetical protein
MWEAGAWVTVLLFATLAVRAGWDGDRVALAAVAPTATVSIVSSAATTPNRVLRWMNRRADWMKP